MKEAMTVSFNVNKAKFTMKDSYFSVKQRGFINVEFIPMVSSPQDQSRKVFSLQHKKSVVLYPESIYDLINNKPIILEYRKERDAESVRLEAKDTSIGWEWSLETLGSSNEIRKVIMKPSEHFYIQRLFNYSIPYIYGWYALGDSRLAEQSLAVEAEFKDPFENI